jgi:hypothetical protein
MPNALYFGDNLNVFSPLLERYCLTYKSNHRGLLNSSEQPR